MPANEKGPKDRTRARPGSEGRKPRGCEGAGGWGIRPGSKRWLLEVGVGVSVGTSVQPFLNPWGVLSRDKAARWGVLDS